MGETLESSIICEEKFTTPDSSIRAVSCSIKRNANDRLIRRQAVVRHATGNMGVVVLDGNVWDALLLSALDCITCSLVVRMQIAGDQLGVNSKYMLVFLDAGFERLERLEIFHIPDVLADKCVPIPSEAECIFYLRSGSQYRREFPR